MICRQWRGWCSREQASIYEGIVRTEVIPAIEARHIPGFHHIDLLRRETADGVEFQTMMWFDNLASIKSFVGDDAEVSHVPERARAVLIRWDERATHFQVLDRRPQMHEQS